MKELSKIQNCLFIIGAMMLLAGAAAFMFVNTYAAIIYIVGSLLFGAMQMLASYDGDSIVLRRLRRQQIFGAICLIVAGGLMLMNRQFVFGIYLRNEWMIALFIGAFFELYTSFRIPAELDKMRK